MKTSLLVAVVLFSGAVNAKEIPSPFWFTISEKILTETQSLFNVEVKECKTSGKKKAAAVKVKVSQACEEDNLISLPFPTFKRGSGIWMITE